MILRRLFVLVVALASCGSSEPSDTGDPAPDATIVIAEPDEIAFRYIESGGIAGDIVVDLVVYGDGTGIVTSFGGDPDPISVPLDELNRILVELEAAGVHHIDQADHPEVPVADGFALGITVHTVNGSSEVAAYALGEAPDLFGVQWHGLFEAGRRAATEIEALP